MGQRLGEQCLADERGVTGRVGSVADRETKSRRQEKSKRPHTGNTKQTTTEIRLCEMYVYICQRYIKGVKKLGGGGFLWLPDR